MSMTHGDWCRRWHRAHSSDRVVWIHTGQMHGRGHGNADKASTGARETVRPRTYVRLVQRTAGQTLLEGVLVDWVRTQPAVEPRLPVAWLSRQQKAAELERIQGSRAVQTAREAELILGLAADCPEDLDLPPDAPGAGRSWRHTEPEFPG